MIGRLRGVIAWKQAPHVLIDVHGVGYEIEASMGTFQILPDVGAEVTLLTHLVVREDAHTLYGFANATERNVFRALVRVSGVGPRLALLILSGMTAERFVQCIRENNAAALTHLPGIGKKTAERLVMELRDRINALATEGPLSTLSEILTIDPVEDAISALVSLGYKLPEATRRVQSLKTDGLSSEALIRMALQASVHT